MFEIAGRAGATTTFYWGNAMDTDYVVCSENAGDSTVAVGSRLPNNWGIYDYSGNVYEWQLDGYKKNYGNLANVADPFSPIWDSSTSSDRCWRGSCRAFSSSTQVSYFRASDRNGAKPTHVTANGGFRVSYIVK